MKWRTLRHLQATSRNLPRSEYIFTDDTGKDHFVEICREMTYYNELTGKRHAIVNGMHAVSASVTAGEMKKLVETDIREGRVYIAGKAIS